MSTTERTVDFKLAESRPTLAARGWTVVATAVGALRNRLAINRLYELDDAQLLDIGLTRSDVETALTTSTFFQDPAAKIVRSAHDRARRMNGHRYGD